MSNRSIDIIGLVAKSENAAVEFKRARGGVPADFWPSYSSFANTDGGVIILGVRENDGKREIEGLANTEKIVADLWNAVNNPDKISANVLFNESIYPVDVDGKAVVVVEVPRAERTVRPVFVGSDVFKGTYRRNGEGDYHCSRETVEGMIRDKCAETADNCILDELTIADLDADTIRRYRMYFSQLRPGHVWSGLADDGFLMKIGAAARGRDGNVHPTLAGLVCFGDFNEITNVLPYFFLDYREHLSPDVRWTDRVCSGDANWSGNIFDFFFRINQSITAGVKVPFKIASDNVTRDDDTPVHKALREVLANALIHADYHGRRGIVIDKYPKRLEVSNPGTLGDLQHLRAGRYWRTFRHGAFKPLRHLGKGTFRRAVHRRELRTRPYQGAGRVRSRRFGTGGENLESGGNRLESGGENSGSGGENSETGGENSGTGGEKPRSGGEKLRSEGENNAKGRKKVEK